MKAATMFMVLTSAFNTVWHDRLIYKLHSMELPAITIKRIIPFLTKRAIKIKTRETFYENIIIQRGVLQGAALNRILYYKIYVNNTPISSNNQIFEPDTGPPPKPPDQQLTQKVYKMV